MYQSILDPYCYPGTTVLKNTAGHIDQADLDDFELSLTTQRFNEALPTGRFTVRHYCSIHHHIFQDIYVWAGKFRAVRISKGGNMFCFPENIVNQLKLVFDKLRAKNFLNETTETEFSLYAADFLADLNAIHAFRDGNGRAQLAVLNLIARRAGHRSTLANIDSDKFLSGMIMSFHGDNRVLAAEIYKILI